MHVNLCLKLYIFRFYYLKTTLCYRCYQHFIDNLHNYYIHPPLVLSLDSEIVTSQNVQSADLL